ncbi:hypothetical protein ACLMJK_008107 [Lecanora helva]
MSIRLTCAAINWIIFAEEWQKSYREFTRAQVDSSENQRGDFKSVDDHNHESLRALLSRYDIAGLWTDEEVLAISRVWHYLDGWPDSSRGIQALRDRGFLVCTLSNGNVSLLKDMADFTNLPWTNIFSAEQFGTYKPDPAVYLGACEGVGLEPARCALVAAHLGDLKAAKACGLQTIYVERDGEESWSAAEVDAAKKANWVDVWIGVEEKNGAGGGILEILQNLKMT